MLNLAIAILPVLGKLFAGGKADDLAVTASRVAREVFGTDKEDEVAAQLQTNPALAEQFKAKLEAETRQQVAQVEAETQQYIAALVDTQNARSANNQLAVAGHAGYWSGPVVDTIVVAGFFGVLIMLLVRPVQLDTAMVTLLTTMVGFLGNSFGQIINYHRGSSASSASKDTVIKNMTAESNTAAANVAARVVEAAARRP